MVFLSSPTLRTRKYVCKLHDVRKHSTFASADVDSWIILTFQAGVSKSFRQKNKRAAAKHSWANTAKHSEASRRSCLMWEKQRWSAEIYARRLSLSVAAASKEGKETTLNLSLWESFYWFVLPDNFIKHPAQTFSVGRIHGSSLFLSLYFSL